ncbi:uncharacterized protein DUF1992 [Kribbella sp. VKM Ac-2527]|uniref:Uncharacterized protein DUF1992 n=1 Tax=Kribbella caucasensis TaxID=2512215 RepID=A0A4R6JG93_9ACTN|nr:DUF1992 domain-containing protein [Kribbella sp. VKM Ac-2527]TDO34692.1 uncharacterized protein DUF1992 [Kribbella sp. VKM Ac-2527]
MTERKPPGMKAQEWVDLQLRQADERGEFDNLALAGKPLPKLAEAHDPDWWVKDFIRREQIDTEVLLPASVQLRKEKERIPETVAKLRTETEVRDYLKDLNERIRIQVRDATGVVVPVGPVDEDEIVEQWLRDRPEPGSVQQDQPEPEPEPKRSFWQRLFS